MTSYDTERKENDLPSDLQISLQDKSVTFRHVRRGAAAAGPAKRNAGEFATIRLV